jgi:GT2 family glycosyltransferase
MLGAVRIRAVVVTFNNAAFVERCLHALLASELPGNATLEVVVVDNASADGTADVVDERFGDRVRVVRNAENRGFAGGNNVALRDLDGVDAVALVNSDAFVTPRWLLPLVEVLQREPRVGAACPKILFEPTFTEVRLTSPTFVPAERDATSHDRRALGLRVVSVRVDGVEQFDRCQFPQGWSWPEGHARWTTGDAVLWVPVLSTSTLIEVIVEGSDEPRRFPVGESFDVVNNVGNELDGHWYGRDRGFREIDRGQYDQPEDVWGWCGAAVLLRSSMLREVGIFDERLFMYYEDTDLSWRGSRAGWRYRYVPASVVRHAHAKSSGEGSAMFDHYNQRNRLVVVWRHAPVTVRAGVAWRYATEVLRGFMGEGLLPLVREGRPRLHHTRRRARAAAAAARFAFRGRSGGNEDGC